MAYVSFRGVRTDSIGLYIAKGGMLEYKKAKQRHIEYDIPGRDGAVHIMDGYGPFDLKVMLQLVDASADIRRVVNAWADGSGDLFSSDDTTQVWKASVLKEVKYSRLEYNGLFYDTATVTFRCQPIRRERVPTVLELTEPKTLTNPGNVPALPKIEVTGTGNCMLIIGGEQISIDNVDGSVTIDSETGYVFSDSGAVTMSGEFPVLGLDDTLVAFAGGVTAVKITPNWGWV